jgi:hypothetical protein
MTAIVAMAMTMAVSVSVGFMVLARIHGYKTAATR